VRRLLASPWARLLGLLGALVLLGWFLGALRHVLTPFVVAFTLAYFLNPPVNALERVLGRASARAGRAGAWLPPRTLAVGVLSGAVMVAAVAVLLLVVPTVSRQVVDTARRLPDYARTLRSEVQPAVERFNLRYPEQIEEARTRLTEFLKEHASEVVSPASLAAQAAFSSLLSLVLAVLNLVVIPVFALYLLHDMNRIQEGIKDLVPHRYRDYVYSRAQAVDQLLSAFLRGQITVCLVLGTFYAVALTACGVPMSVLVGYAVGFFNLIPFMSTLLGLPMVLLLKFVDDHSLGGLLAVAVVFLVGQFAESHFLTPRVVGEKLGLHAVVIMLAVLVGGTLFGFIGMLVAMPVTAALSVFWADLRALYLGSEFYRGAAGP
jgi:predicted PurR-regulated permease PerM